MPWALMSIEGVVVAPELMTQKRFQNKRWTGRGLSHPRAHESNAALWFVLQVGQMELCLMPPVWWPTNGGMQEWWEHGGSCEVAWQQSRWCHFICATMKWSLFENSKLLCYLFIYLFIGEKKCIMWWHKILIICPGIHTSRRINQSNKTNSIDWLSDYIKHSVSMWSFAAIHCVVYDYKLFFSTKHTMLKCHYCLGEIIIISCCQCLRFKKKTN